MSKDSFLTVLIHKNAAHYDLKTVNITMPNGEVCSVVRAARNVIGFMKDFYRDYPEEVQEILDFEDDKFVNPENRYAWKVRRQFEDSYVKKGLELARQRQEEYEKEAFSGRYKTGAGHANQRISQMGTKKGEE